MCRCEVAPAELHPQQNTPLFLKGGRRDSPPVPNALLAVGASAVDKDALGGDVA